MVQKPKGAVRGWPQVRVFRELLRADAWITHQVKAFVEREVGLSMSEFDMIAELGNQSGVRMSDLATKMVVSPANVTRIAQALAAKGLVVRERAEHSDREVLASLTREGDALFQRWFPVAAGTVAALVDSQLTEAEQRTLADLLGKVGRAPYVPKPASPESKRTRPRSTRRRDA